MQTYTWLTLPEAACYLRTSEAIVRAKVEKGEIPYSDFDGRPLFHKSQLDEYLFSLQAGQAKRVDQASPLSINPETPGGDQEGAPPKETHRAQDEEARPSEAPAVDDFMAEACRLWDDGQEFLVKAGVRGASCQFNGKPRLWVFPNKLQVPAKGKGNEIYVEIRKALADHFPRIISKATVRITSPSFSWRRFVEFVSQVKNICHRENQGVTSGTQSHGVKKPVNSSVYERCIKLWEDPPAFTIKDGIRGYSARHNNKPRLWFFQDSVRIPTEGQGNSMFKNVRDIKERLFPNASTRTRVDIGDSDVDLDRLYTFIAEVKKLCVRQERKTD